MGTFSSWPNFNAWLQTAWGAGMEYWKNCQYYGATNLVFGQNPPYYLDDFLATYSKFFGQPTNIAGCSTGTSLNQIIVPSSALFGLAVGQFLTTYGVFPLSTVITAINGTAITVSTSAPSVNSDFAVSVYTTPALPAFVIQLYLSLANASLQEARWQEQWYVAMGWFIAHYCTLWCQTEATDVALAYQTIIHGETPQPVIGDSTGKLYTISSQPPGQVLDSFTVNGSYLQPGVGYTLAGVNITLTAAPPLDATLYVTWQIQSAVQTQVPPSAAQVAAQGLAGGIQTSKSVGDVSVSYQTLTSLESWGAWNLTKYGQQLVTAARVIGAGPMVIW